MANENSPRKGDAARDVAAFGAVGFEAWVRTVAWDLTQNLAGRHVYKQSSPGSVSEAQAFLLSTAGLAPDEEGYPTLTEPEESARHTDFELLAVLLYGAAFPDEYRLDPGLSIYTQQESDLDPHSPPGSGERRSWVEKINAAGMVSRPGRETVGPTARRTVLIFHDPALLLTISKGINDADDDTREAHKLP